MSVVQKALLILMEQQETLEHLKTSATSCTTMMWTSTYYKKLGSLGCGWHVYMELAYYTMALSNQQAGKDQAAWPFLLGCEHKKHGQMLAVHTYISQVRWWMGRHTSWQSGYYSKQEESNKWNWVVGNVYSPMMDHEHDNPGITHRFLDHVSSFTRQ